MCVFFPGLSANRTCRWHAPTFHGWKLWRDHPGAGLLPHSVQQAWEAQMEREVHIMLELSKVRMHDKKFLFGQLRPQVRKSDFFFFFFFFSFFFFFLSPPPHPLTYQSVTYMILVRHPINPTAHQQVCTSCVWTMIDRTGTLESSLLYGWVLTPQLLYRLRLGLLP